MIYLDMFLLIFIALAIIFLIISSMMIFKSCITRRLRDENESYNFFLNKKVINDELYKSLDKEDIEMMSIDGFKLSSMLFLNKEKTNKFIILVHGISIGYVGSLKYLDIFFNKGFNVLIMHQRRHGKSEGKYSTYGYFEKYDVNLWINYLVNRFGKDIIVGLHGESMGASTVIQTIPLNPNIKFVIEDCGYSDLYELMLYELHFRFNKILHYPLLLSLKFTNFIIKVKAKFRFQDVSPIKIVKNTSIPIMFIHGNKDTFVPWYMCEKFYKAKVNGLKEIFLVDNAAHTEAVQVNKEAYAEKVFNFIQKALSYDTSSNISYERDNSNFSKH
ncbi:MAG: alpha/beta hydrolase [Clostridium perfringens]|nr:alpha/beta hydrolase [Clostridium perfringens]